MQRSFKKALITGGCGFIGSCLIRNLLQNSSIEILNLDKMGYASREEGITNLFKDNNLLRNKYNFLKIHLKDKDKLEKIIYKYKPDLVIHLAAESHVDKSIVDPSSFVINNIIGTTNLLEVLLEYWRNLIPQLKNNFCFLHVSTDEVFGSLSGNNKFTENSSYSPNSPYSASKAASDHFVRAWHKTYNFPVITTNCSNNFGPWQFPEKLIPIILINCLKKEKIPIYGDGSNIRDWIYVEDHVDALIKCAFGGRFGETYCIGGNNEVSNLHLAELICDLMNKKCPWRESYSSLINFVKDRPGHDFRYAIDSSKIKKELNWGTKYDFEKALSMTLDWYLDNKDWLVI